MSSGEEHKTVKKIGLQQLIKGDLLSTLYGALIILPWLCNGSIMIIAYIVYVVSRNAAQAELVDLFFSAVKFCNGWKFSLLCVPCTAVAFHQYTLLFWRRGYRKDYGCILFP